MECPLCKGKMNIVKDIMPKEKVDFEAYQCEKCGEQLINMQQLKVLAKKYRDLRKAKDTIFAKWGNSLAVRIPIEILGEMGIKEGTHALIKREKDAIKIVPA